MAHYLIGAFRTLEIWTDHQKPPVFPPTTKVIVDKARWLTELHNTTSNFSTNQARPHKPDFLSRPPGIDKGRMTTKTSFYYRNTTFVPFIYDFSGAEYLFEPSLKQSENDYPAQKRQYQNRHSRLNTNDTNWIDHGHGLYLQGQIYIPADSRLRTDLIHEHHDTVAAGHQDDTKPGTHHSRLLVATMQGHSASTLLDATFSNAPKSSREKPRNPLHPHEIPLNHGNTFSIDLITGLPESKRIQCFLVIIDRFPKMILLVAIRDTLPPPNR